MEKCVCTYGLCAITNGLPEGRRHDRVRVIQQGESLAAHPFGAHGLLLRGLLLLACWLSWFLSNSENVLHICHFGRSHRHNTPGGHKPAPQTYPKLDGGARLQGLAISSCNPAQLGTAPAVSKMAPLPPVDQRTSSKRWHPASGKLFIPEQVVRL